jgi:hypothetical protein
VLVLKELVMVVLVLVLVLAVSTSTVSVLGYCYSTSGGRRSVPCRSFVWKFRGSKCEGVGRGSAVRLRDTTVHGLSAEGRRNVNAMVENMLLWKECMVYKI